MRRPAGCGTTVGCMGRHSHDAGPVTADWEEPPPVAPLWRARIITSAVLLFAVVAGAWWTVGWLTSPAGPGGEPAPSPAVLDDRQDGQATTTPDDSTADASSPAPPGTASAEPADTLVVHVAGEVREPGLVELPAGSRVADALYAAGGPTGRAKLALLNLAAPAVDSSQILVPGPDTPTEAAGTTAGTPSTAGDAGTHGPTGTGTAGSGPGTINVNTADAATLEQLPGIGPALAARIIDHREQVGPFGSLEDLDAVSGIGPAMMERLDGLVGW